jgi:putative DNA methylase
LLTLVTFANRTRLAEKAMQDDSYPQEWVEAIASYLALATDRLADYSSAICSWHNSGEKLRNTFSRFAFPIVWDFAEVSPIGETSGSYSGAIEWISLFLVHGMDAARGAPTSKVLNRSSTKAFEAKYDVILTDPPYYDAISYCDLMDFFHVWLRRITHGLSPEITSAFQEPLGPKWDHSTNDGELVDDPSRHSWDRNRSKVVYEDGMYRTFLACNTALEANGRFVVVFAHKHSDAWETLASAIIRAGFVVDASWPIQTEMGNRARALTSSALASSVWLVCKKRPLTARPGWDNKVLDEMRSSISRRLRDFWDAGIRGPDFVWAATGPALEAYSKHPIVKLADEAGKVMTVSDFLSHARRMVVDFVVGRVLSGDSSDAVPAMDRLDEPTAYYLLHRHDFGLDEAPAGACILYATACGLSDDALLRDWDLLARTGGEAPSDDEDEEGEIDEADEPSEDTGSGSKVKLKPWNHRRGRSLGVEAPGGRPVPLIDRLHCLMHLWKGGDVHKVDEYLDEHGLRRHELFHRVLQSLIELSRTGGEERSLLESLSNHVRANGVKKGALPTPLLREDE